MINFPFANDLTTNKPSVTLLFAYVSFLICVASITALHFFSQLQSASLISIGFFIVCLVFYRLRRLDDVKINVKTGAVELSGDSKDG